MDITGSRSLFGVIPRMLHARARKRAMSSSVRRVVTVLDSHKGHFFKSQAASAGGVAMATGCACLRAASAADVRIRLSRSALTLRPRSIAVIH